MKALCDASGAVFALGFLLGFGETLQEHET